MAKNKDPESIAAIPFTRKILCVESAREAAVFADQARELLGGIDEIAAMSEMTLPGHWEYAKRLRDSGVKRILLAASGWWLGDEEPPKVLQVVDHVACRLPGPLTGSIEAREGKAFVDMREAYVRLDVINRRFSTIRQVVLWHTKEIASLPEDEKKMARWAGCPVASPFVVPWAVSAKGAGMQFAAAVFPLRLG